MMNTWPASPMAVLDEQAMQFGESRHRRAWRTQSEGSAGDLVQHPGSDSDNDAAAHLYMYKLAVGATLAVHASQATAVQRVPAVEDLNFLPDMGRMNRNWRSADRIGSSPEACGRASGRPPS